ncbi:MAG: hypothetical protein WDM88_07185 [Galbitalea sp.]
MRLGDLGEQALVVAAGPELLDDGRVGFERHAVDGFERLGGRFAVDAGVEVVHIGLGAAGLELAGLELGSLGLSRRGLGLGVRAELVGGLHHAGSGFDHVFHVFDLLEETHGGHLLRSGAAGPHPDERSGKKSSTSEGATAMSNRCLTRADRSEPALGP